MPSGPPPPPRRRSLDLVVLTALEAAVGHALLLGVLARAAAAGTVHVVRVSDASGATWESPLAVAPRLAGRE